MSDITRTSGVNVDTFMNNDEYVRVTYKFVYDNDPENELEIDDLVHAMKLQSHMLKVLGIPVLQDASRIQRTDINS